MKTFTLTLMAFFLILQNSYAQKEGYNWYFGYNAGIDFNSGAPVALTNSVMSAFEGCGSISDATGNLLFYTDGLDVFNSNHTGMQNGSGLSGGGSSAQGGLIVQMPGSNTMYYIFTIVDGGTGSSSYSIVDMSLAGGLGAVTTKNAIMIAANATEKQTAVRSSNGLDFWVIQHLHNTNDFYAFPVTSTGVGVPVISSCGTIHSSVDYGGTMKASPSGNKLASAIHGQDAFELYDFDNTTGIVSNAIFLGNTYSIAYGVCFSPDGSKLYGGNEGNSVITQWDLSSGSAPAIIASSTSIGTTIGGAGALQFGPDHKMYITHNSTFMDVIEYPDSLCPACNYISNGFSLGGNSGAYGLPNFISNTFSSSFGFINTCEGDSTQFNIFNFSGLFGVTWNFGDTASGLNNVSYLNNPIHYFSTSGTFNVTALLYFSSHTDTVIVPVIINPLPLINLGTDTSFCTGSTFVMHAGTGYSSYLWQDNSTDSILSANAAGTFWVTVSNNGCSATDTLVLTTVSCAMPVVSLSSSDTIFCGKEYINFTDLSTNSPTSWQWTFQGAAPPTSTDQNPLNIYYNAYGSFDVTLIACNGAGCDTLFLPLFITEFLTPAQPVITLINDTLYSTPAFAYAWYNTINPGTVISTGSFYVPLSLGSYFVTITDSNGCQNSSAIFDVTGIEHTFSNNQPFIFYPNPVNNELLLDVNKSLFPGNISIRIIDVLGQQIYFANLYNSHNIISFLSSTPGIYFIFLETEKGIFKNKIIVNH